MPESLLNRLLAGEPVPEPVMLVAAHPDDEIIGAGSRLHLFTNLILVHVTDGSPRNLHDAAAYGFGSAAEYAAARRAELQEALTLAGAAAAEVLELGIADQEASLNMAGVAARLAELYQVRRPAYVLTHPYEGGHPDHDAVAFAVHAACTLAPQRPALIEFTSYHRENCRFVAGRFLGRTPLCEILLSPSEQRHKRLMLDCFDTQRETLAQFGLETERFRPAPAYDFTLPPHEGALHYEHYDWGMTGDRFRALAREALSQIRGEGAAA